MSQILSFASKVSKVKTRTKKDKDYYTFRINIPKEISDKLELSKDDYLLLKAMKAEWYHLLDWREMQKTWNKMPEELREKIRNSGLETPGEPDTLTQANHALAVGPFHSILGGIFSGMMTSTTPAATPSLTNPQP